VVAEEDGRLLSTCNIAIVPNLTRSARPYAVIENVVTRSGARRRGLGRACIMKAIEFAKENGCYKGDATKRSRKNRSPRLLRESGIQRDR
jgi:GNAT superfamily N-acetyltransferase